MSRGESEVTEGVGSEVAVRVVGEILERGESLGFVCFSTMFNTKGGGYPLAENHLTE